MRVNFCESESYFTIEIIAETVSDASKIVRFGLNAVQRGTSITQATKDSVQTSIWYRKHRNEETMISHD